MKLAIYLFLILASNLALSSDCSISSRELLSLNEAIDLSVTNNPIFKSSWFNVKQKEYERLLTISKYFPQVGLNLARQRSYYSGSYSKDNIVPGDNTSNFTFNTLKWTIFDFGAREQNVLLSNSMLNIARYEYDIALKDLIFKTSKDYIEAQGYKATLKAYDDAFKLAENTMFITDKLYQNGIVKYADFVEAKSNYLKRAGERSQAKKDYALARANISYHTGCTSDLTFDVEEIAHISLQPHRKSLTAWLDLVKTVNPEIHNSIEKTKASKIRRNVVISDALPSIEFYSNRSKNGVPGSPSYEPWTTQRMIGVQVTFPLFTGFKDSANVLAHNVEVQKKQQDEIDINTKLNSNVAVAYTNVSTGLEQIRYTTEYLEHSKKSFILQQKLYTSGLSNIFNFIKSESSVSDAEILNARAKTEYLIHRLNLLYYSGVIGMDILSGDLN